MNNLSKTFVYINENGDSIAFLYDKGFLINKPDGIDTLSIKTNQAQGINQTGTTIQSINVQARPVTISGVLVGAFQTDNKSKLLSVIRPDLKGKLYADDYYLDVYPSATPKIEAKKDFARFQFSMIAAYPYWQKDESATATLAGFAKRFKFPWNISKPYRFGEEITAQFINISNRGHVPIPFTVTFSALSEVVNPILTDAATGDYLLVNKTMIPGEKIVIEITHERMNCTSSVDGECRGAVDLSSKLYRLAVGDNVLKPDAESGKEDMKVDISYSIEIVGVSV